MTAQHIVGMDVRRETLPLSVPYGITNEWIDSATILLVRVRTADGFEAHGAATPSPRVVGDTLESTEETLRTIAAPWLLAEQSAPPLALLRQAPAELIRGPAAHAAVDIALHDLHAQRIGLPLHRWLGTRPDDLITSVTIGICGMEETLRQARSHTDAGFACIKVKVGESLEEDIARVLALREALGSGVRIRVDANQGYDADEACRFVDAMRDVRIELLEQPTPAGDLESLRHVTLYAGSLPVMADEEVLSVEDAQRVLDSGAASAINIKLMKCGGIAEGRKIAQACRAHNVRCMLGCFDESRISMAAAAHLALSDDQIWWADLDGHLDLARDVARGGINIAAGRVTVPDQPGLGVEVDPAVFAENG